MLGKLRLELEDIVIEKNHFLGIDGRFLGIKGLGV